MAREPERKSDTTSPSLSITLRAHLATRIARLECTGHYVAGGTSQLLGYAYYSSS